MPGTHDTGMPPAPAVADWARGAMLLTGSAISTAPRLPSQRRGSISIGECA